ncbi:aldolase [Dacryopinax primogenitus]|uniref:Aldolase n=1 Tax=Dacryopinax primogenitus (strain DJM 731) TaxID=1858805 RepID=M5GDW6_DACPD|nr:aldolase [Dacryopinax primogenitus]EJU02753.1 aldolase [Dacryopinax primogenitus]
MPPSAPPPGIYVPTLTFFQPTQKQELDLQALTSHIARLAQARVQGIVLLHPIGEPHHLSRDERTHLLTHTQHFLSSIPAQLTLIVGCSAPSTWETIDLCEEAAALGGAYCLVNAPGGEDELGDSALEGYFFDVADQSPLPLLLSPSHALPLPLLQRLAQHPNIVSLLLTSPSLALQLSSTFPTKSFSPMATQSDALLPMLCAGAQGAILPLGNVAPEALVQIWESWNREDLPAAQALQRPLARCGAIERAGTRGVRAALSHVKGYGGWSRRPVLAPGEKEREEINRACEVLEGKGKSRPGMPNGVQH